MKDRIVAVVRIHHHRVETLPYLRRLQTSGDRGVHGAVSPIGAPKGLLTALALSAVLWGVIAAISF